MKLYKTLITTAVSGILLAAPVSGFAFSNMLPDDAKKTELKQQASPAGDKQISENTSKQPVTNENNDPKAVVVTVNGINLIRADLNQEIMKILPYNQNFHGGIKEEALERVRKEAMQKLVDSELQYQYALSKGMKLKPEEMKDEVEKLSKPYKTKKAFDKVISDSGFSEEQFNRFVERNVLVPKIVKAEVNDKVQIKDSDLKDYYDKNVQRYSKPEEFRASHILCKVDPSSLKEQRDEVKKRAEGILEKIKKGADFADTAATESDDLTRIKGGDIGSFHIGQAVEEFEDAVKNMKVGEVSGIVESLYGYHIIKLTDRKPPRQLLFDEVKEKLRRDFEKDAKTKRYDNWMAEIKKTAKITFH